MKTTLRLGPLICEQTRASSLFAHWARCRISRHVDPHPVVALHFHIAWKLALHLIRADHFRHLFQVQLQRVRRLRLRLCPFCGVRPAKFDRDCRQVVTCPRCYKEVPMEEYAGPSALVWDWTKDTIIEQLGGNEDD